MATIKRTYGSSGRKGLKPNVYPPSSPISTLSSSPPASPVPCRPAKRSFSSLSPLESSENVSFLPPTKKSKTALKQAFKPKPATKTSGKAKGPQKTLTQLYFNTDQSILRECTICKMSYTKGTPDDEALHKANCLRFQQGLEWGREMEKDRMRNGDSVVVEVKSDVKLKGSKEKGRIISFQADIGGKIGNKLSNLLSTVNHFLSATDLPQETIRCSKAYLFLIPHEIHPTREKIVGLVIAQRISTAMATISAKDVDSTTTSAPSLTVSVDSTTNIYCSPTPLPTPMGISRIFVSSSHRRLGIAHALLDAAAATFIHGCPLDPLKGQVAFTQPTSGGQAVMESWGKGHVRIYEE